jgi:CBS domain-containing membrane protein
LKTAADFMTRAPILVPHDASLARCGRLMLDQQVRQLPVVDQRGQLLGLLTEDDLFRRGSMAGLDQDRWEAHDDDDNAAVAADVMRIGVQPLDMGVSVLRVLNQLIEDDLHVVVVQDGAHVRGIVTEHDAVQVAARVLPPELGLEDEATTSVVTVHMDTGTDEAWASMQEHAIRHLIVTDRDNRIRSVLSHQDLAVAFRGEQTYTTVAEIPRLGVIHAAAPGVTAHAAASQMAELKVGCLPLADDAGHPVGIVTRRDIIHALLIYLEDELDV